MNNIGIWLNNRHVADMATEPDQYNGWAKTVHRITELQEEISSNDFLSFGTQKLKLHNLIKGAYVTVEIDFDPKPDPSLFLFSFSFFFFFFFADSH